MSKSPNNILPFSQSDKNSTDSSDDELELLRGLLFSRERACIAEEARRLELLEHRLSDPEVRAQDSSEVLVKALKLSQERNGQFADEIAPIVVDKFHETARANPDVMAEALFPILGPAVRKMIAGMISPDPKTKKRPYRLEQLFLIDKETGVPVCHVASDAAITQDADMVGGMLNAIQSFVHEAFAANEFDGLNTLQVGELSVWIEWGPSAVLAGVIRGNAPQKLRDSLQVLLEEIHQQFVEEFKDYQGDSSAFDLVKPKLLSFLDNHDGSLKTRVRNLTPTAKKWLAGAVAAGFALVMWMLFTIYDSNRWLEYVALLESEPGIVVTRAERSLGGYKVVGLSDPLARKPSEILSQTSLNENKVNHQFEPYLALNQEIVLRRVHRLIEIPSELSISLVGSTLIFRGAADDDWVAHANAVAKQIPGISGALFLDE